MYKIHGFPTALPFIVAYVVICTGNVSFFFFQEKKSLLMANGDNVKFKKKNIFFIGYSEAIAHK